MPKNKNLSDSEASSDEDIKKKTKKTSKKRKASTSDSDSGPEDRGPAKKPAPVANKKTSAGSSNGEASWCLEGMRFVKVDEFRGRPLISIREYYEKDGKVLPGKKGISLSATQWRKLVDLVENVNEELKKY